MRTLVIMLLLALILQGCGRKGPLFLPKHADTKSQSSLQITLHT
ncbi:MAG: lipoprotein [Sideroxydans sp.]|nr:lipoprotein [Sideroxydans sp.]